MINGMITVRSQSKRLPEKCFLEFGNGNVLEHLIKRARFFSIDPIISTTDNPLDNRIEKIADKHDVKCFRGSESDKILRWEDTCTEFNLENFITIDGDDLFFDGELNRKSHETLVSGDYDMVMHPKMMPYHGCVGYSIKAEILSKVCEQKKTSITDNHWEFIQEIDESKYTYLNTKFYEETKIRLTLDYIEDYWMLSTVLRILGHNASGEKIIKLFSENKDLHKINWFRTHDYLKGTGGIA